jgi:glycine hydroxymethyltransferase
LLREDWLAEYVRRLVPSALALERELAVRRIPVVPRDIQGDRIWPALHHIWIRYDDADTAFAAYKSLSHANIHVNYRKLPFRLGWGLRLGTSHAVSAGLTVARTGEVADLVASALAGTRSHDVRQRVAALALDFARNAIAVSSVTT